MLEAMEEETSFSRYSYVKMLFQSFSIFTIELGEDPQEEMKDFVVAVTLVLLLHGWVRFGEEPPPLIRPDTGTFSPWRRFHLRFLKQWILQLRASPSCRMT